LFVEMASPSQLATVGSQRVRLFATGSITTISVPDRVVLRYQKRPSRAHVAFTVPPTTRPLSEGSRNCRARS
jgi:hypothetical protein